MGTLVVPEIAVAFPDDEATAELIAGRLRTEGVAARVDRGLHASWQVAARGQMSVLVDARDRARAYEVLGTVPRSDAGPGRAAWVAVAILAASLIFGIGAIVVNVFQSQGGQGP